MTMYASSFGRFALVRCALVGIAFAYGVATAAPPTAAAAPDRPTRQAKADHDVYRDTVLPLLKRHCESKLRAAQEKIDRIVVGTDDVAVGLEPADIEGH